jgi:hypothetical protein
VLFSFLLTNTAGGDEYRYLSSGDFQLADSADGARDPLLAVIGRRAPPVRIREDETLGADLVFEVPEGSAPAEVSFDQGFLSDKATFRFR